MIKIALLATGDELCDGRVTNTNQRDIAELLSMLGLTLHHCLTVGDLLADIESGLKMLLPGHDLVLVTGGLGPTEDDRTTQAVAKALGSSIMPNKEALKDIDNFFKKRGYPMPKTNLKQAGIPKEAILIKNKVGTAPGYYIKQTEKVIVVMPGVPKEMLPMMKDVVRPLIQTTWPHLSAPLQHTYRCYGEAESTLAERIEPLYPLPKGVEISFRVPFPDILVRLKVIQGGDPSKKIMTLYKKKLQDLLGGCVYAEEDITMTQTVFKALKRRQQTVALAESCTGGLIAHMLTSEPGASQYLKLAIIPYSNSAKIRVLDVPEEQLQTDGAVSESVARHMAKQVLTIAQSDWGLSVTGIAGPEGGSDDKPVGTVYIGLANKKGAVLIQKRQFQGNRKRIQRVTAFDALYMLQKQLI